MLFLSLYLSISVTPEVRLFSYEVTLMIQIVLSIFIIPFIRMSREKGNLNLIFLFMCLICWFLITSITSAETASSVSRLLLSFGPGVMVLLIVISDVNPLFTFIRVSKWFMWSGIIFSIVGILLTFFGDLNSYKGVYYETLSIGPIEVSQVVVHANEFLRIASLLDNPNNFGLLLFFSIMSTLALKKLDEIDKYFFVLILLIQISALLMTISRASLLSSVVGIGFFFLLTSKGLHQLSNRIILGFLTGLLGLVLFLTVFNDISAFDRSSGFAGREVAWEIAISNIKENFMIGIGFATSDIMLEKLGLDISTHNMHLSLLLEAGIIGYILFIMIWLYGISRGVINHLSTKGAKNFKISVMYATSISIMISLLLHQMFETKIPYTGFFTLFWFYFLGIAFCKVFYEKGIEVT